MIAMKQESKRKTTAVPSRGVRYAIVLALILLAGTNAYTFKLLSDAKARGREQAGESPAEFADSLGAYDVVNAHDHLMSRAYLQKYLDAARETGVTRTIFVASSEYTLMGAGHDQAKGNHENTLEVLEAVRENRGAVIAFAAIHPDDPEKLERLKTYVAQGARGLKLYTGHGNFYQHPLDWEGMEEVYAYCESTRLPICWHVNITRYQAEFERVMRRHPNMIVIVPHFGVTFFRPRQQPFREFQRLLDTYPNLYTDTSFGTREILVSGLEAVSRDRDIFRAFFEKYSDRILFGTDMVVTGNKEKTPEWIEAVLRACRDVLEKETFHFYMGAKGSPYADKKSKNIYGAYRGLNLSDDILRKVYETNIEKILPRQP